MNIQTGVQIARNWENEFKKREQVITQLVSIHITVDQISGNRECQIYTDDGKGNGDLILKFSLD
jgi:hypothetical protein